MRKKIDSRIRTLVENCHKLRQRSMFVIVGDKGRDQVVNLHYMLSKTVVKARPSVLWCYKKDLYLSRYSPDHCPVAAPLTATHMGAVLPVFMTDSSMSTPAIMLWRLVLCNKGTLPCQKHNRRNKHMRAISKTKHRLLGCWEQEYIP